MNYKILFISEILGIGGGGIASQRIIDCFKNDDIQIISLKNEKNYFFKFKYFAIRVFYRLKRLIVTTSGKFNFNSFNANVGVYSEDNITKKIKNFSPDIIVVTWIEFIISLKTLYKLKKKFNSKIIFVAMDNNLLTGGCRYVNECKNYLESCKNCLALKKKFKKIAYTNFNYYRYYFEKIDPMFMFPSNHSKNFYNDLNLSYKFLEFDFWPIHSKQFQNLNTKRNLVVNNFFNELKKKDKKIIICPIQNFSEPRKGWIYLYNSIIDFQSKVIDDKIALHFIFIGKKETKHIKSFNKFKVTYNNYKYLSRKDLEKLYSISDFGIVPSIQEWASISSNEMMMFGLPVINFMTGSATNIIKEGKNGFVAKLKDINNLTEILLKINDMTQEEMLEMKMFTHDFAIKNFKSEIFKKKLINFYEENKENS
mgnify:CR=1 FL=1|tara:strand:+ start:6820 stop:8091 length:1272 start_codon:yes stop_codon:yes gene_type:complete